MKLVFSVKYQSTQTTKNKTIMGNVEIQTHFSRACRCERGI